MKTFEQFTEGSLHKWFKGSKSKDGKPGWVNVKTGGTCASDEPGEGTPKCVSSSKRASMTKAERESASRRKKAADPNQQQKSGAAKPTYVATDKKKKKVEEAKDVLKVAKELTKASKMHKGQAEKLKKHADDMKEGLKHVVDGEKYLKLPKKYKKLAKDKSDFRSALGKAKDAVTDKLGKTNTDRDGVKDSSKRVFTMQNSYEPEGESVDEACWKGYKAYGMKKKGGKMVPNCKPVGSVKKEEVEVDESMGGGVPLTPQELEIQKKMSRLNVRLARKRSQEMQKAKIKDTEVAPEQVKEGKSPAWQRKEGKRESGGLNQKGVDSYRRENPGSKLKTAVTTKPSKLKKGSKSANRRKSFCARMSGMKKKLTSAKTANDPDSRINKSLRKWNCSYEPDGTPIMEGINFSAFRKKASTVEKKPKKAMDAGAKARRSMQRREYAKTVSGSTDRVPKDLED